ncbi:hypothetical protein [Acuticoccus sediminis]|uniref:hypothetical protein n=1 Tax=Acuticoccus sediminis TaxID=2184697 RepID=UPI001CFDBF98|nr:hypothetical protein [Acuticoccus sediminis]
MTDQAQSGVTHSSAPPKRTTPREYGYAPGRRLPYVANVSWPRSGHVLLSRILRQTFQGWFGYCEYYTPRQMENSPCCGSFPCERAGLINMSKQHDFGFKAELPSDHPLIVQYRSFLPSVVSHWEQRIATSSTEDSEEAFRAFALKQALEYKTFLDRWVHSARTNRLLLPYEAFTANPSQTMRQVLALFEASDYVAAMERVIATVDGLTFVDGGQQRIKGAGIADRRDVSTYRYYDEPFFAELGTLTRTDPA